MNTTKKTADNGSATEGRRVNAVDANIGERVRERRNGVGMSLETLGERIGVTYQQVQKYEKGTNRIGAARLQAIAAALDVPVTWFFDRGDEPPTEPRTREELTLLSSFRSLDPVLKRRVLDLVESMAQAEQLEAA